MGLPIDPQPHRPAFARTHLPHAEHKHAEAAYGPNGAPGSDSGAPAAAAVTH
ncbi:hypothetical protein [Burkholderia sp. KCJ3K979]|uniref:hypothetical protein n=1 Tax=Burkholderia sp. KCJ3K979 TaxID=2759149 RepID=UPI001F45ED1E|nr:hypothetical protein [Burkholderia sp. KCJ3K979]